MKSKKIPIGLCINRFVKDAFEIVEYKTRGIKRLQWLNQFSWDNFQVAIQRNFNVIEKYYGKQDFYSCEVSITQYKKMLKYNINPFKYTNKI